MDLRTNRLRYVDASIECAPLGIVRLLVLNDMRRFLQSPLCLPKTRLCEFVADYRALYPQTQDGHIRLDSAYQIEIAIAEQYGHLRYESVRDVLGEGWAPPGSGAIRRGLPPKHIGDVIRIDITRVPAMPSKPTTRSGVLRNWVTRLLAGKGGIRQGALSRVIKVRRR